MKILFVTLRFNTLRE